MEIEIKLDNMKKYHKKEMSDVLKSFEKKSKKKLTASEKGSVKFFYSYGISIRPINSGSIFEIIKDMKEEFRKIEKEKSITEKVNETLDSIVGLSILAKFGRRKEFIQLTEKPKKFIKEITDKIKLSEENTLQEKKRLSNLTPEEREIEQQELINELYKQPGFIGIGITQDGPIRLEPKKINYYLDDILDKISRLGIENLTKGEKDFLKKQSK